MDLDVDDGLLITPTDLPIFPLEGAVLLPHGHLPLHVFEPRYINMIEAALGRHRMIGMIQPRDKLDHPTPDTAALYATGCAGKIVSFSETEDGRFLITLRGICRFNVAHELEMERGFRRVTPNFEPFRQDLDDPSDDGVDRGDLLGAARLYLEARSIECDWEAAESASAQSLITTFSMICPFDPREKQALLECRTLEERGTLLVSLFRMSVLEGDSTFAGTKH